jgi:hypothetical protein
VDNELSFVQTFYDSHNGRSISIFDPVASDSNLRFVEILKFQIGLLSSTVRRGQPTTYVFRNYAVAPGFCSRFPGNTGLKYSLGDAVRASSAAPGVFREAKIGGEVHIDGGLTSNNPTAVAIHECQNIWPRVPIRAGGVDHGHDFHTTIKRIMIVACYEVDGEILVPMDRS